MLDVMETPAHERRQLPIQRSMIALDPIVNNTTSG
jgi:hypothetical protein